MDEKRSCQMVLRRHLVGTLAERNKRSCSKNKLVHIVNHRGSSQDVGDIFKVGCCQRISFNHARIRRSRCHRLYSLNRMGSIRHTVNGNTFESSGMLIECWHVRRAQQLTEILLFTSSPPQRARRPTQAHSLPPGNTVQCRVRSNPCHSRHTTQCDRHEGCRHRRGPLTVITSEIFLLMAIDMAYVDAIHFGNFPVARRTARPKILYLLVGGLAAATTDCLNRTRTGPPHRRPDQSPLIV